MPALPDDELLERARHARNGHRFRLLFDEGCTETFAGDHSRADLALRCMLAFWTGGDASRIDRLLRRSTLMRSKWDERHAADGSTYRQMTIHKALSGRVLGQAPQHPW